MSQPIPGQRAIWSKKHAAGDHDHLRDVPSPFSRVAEPYFPEKSYVLELGCGVGRDAVFFASMGHKVLATDGADVVTRQNQQYFADSNVIFDTLDIGSSFPFEPKTFDVVYANLSLHYYSDQKTKEILKDVARILKPNGIFAFACKSDDVVHRQGTEVEPNIFVLPKGVTIHFFSEAYVRSLAKDSFSIVHIDTVGEKYNGRYSEIIRCIAKATAVLRA